MNGQQRGGILRYRGKGDRSGSPLLVLFLMAFATIAGVARLERLRAVVTFSAELACVDVRHLHFISALLHLENLRMTVITFQAFFCMDLAVKNDLAGLRIPIHRLSGRNRHGTSYEHSAPHRLGRPVARERNGR